MNDQYITREEFEFKVKALTDAIETSMIIGSIANAYAIANLNSVSAIENAIKSLESTKESGADALSFQPVTDETIKKHRNLCEAHLSHLRKVLSSLRQ